MYPFILPRFYKSLNSRLPAVYVGMFSSFFSHFFPKQLIVCILFKFYLWIKSSKGVWMGSKEKKGPKRCQTRSLGHTRYVIFFMYKFCILFLLHSNQQQPTTANEGQRRPMKAHSSQRRPMKSNAGPRR